MGVAPGQAVGQVVVLATVVLAHDLAQVVAVAAEGVGDHLVQTPALPVRQDQEHRGGGDQAAEQGIEQARPDQPVAIADLVEAEQHHQRDCGRGQGVARAAGGEEHHSGDHGEQCLHRLAGEQIEQRPADHQAEHGAADALHQLDPGGAIVGLADEYGGQQHPVALLGVDGVQRGVTRDQGDGHAQGVAEQQGRRRQLQADAVERLAQRLRLAIQQAAVLRAFQRGGIAGTGELALQGGEVARQRTQRAQQAAPGRVVLLAQVLQRRLQVLQCLGIGLAVAKRLAQLDGLAEFAAGAGLQT